MAGIKSGEKWIDAGQENEAAHKKGTPVCDVYHGNADERHEFEKQQ